MTLWAEVLLHVAKRANSYEDPPVVVPPAEEIVRRLAARSRPVLVAARFGAIRVSPYLPLVHTARCRGRRVS